MDGRHILDLRVGTPWSAGALELLARSAGSAWADPSHAASEGRRAATWLEAARATVSQLAGLPHVEFFSHRNAAVRAVIGKYPDLRVSAPATHRRPVLALADQVIDVDADGAWLDWPDARLAIIQAANEETGRADAAPVADVLVLDASNAFARMPELAPADHVIADAAMWGAPGGIAFVAGRTPIDSGETPPLPLVALAVQRLSEHWPTRHARAQEELDAMRRFRNEVERRIPDVQFHSGAGAAHMTSFSVLHLDAETLMRALDVEGYVVGSGSACVHDGTPSHVLAAMGRITHGNVRLALPVDFDLAVLDGFANTLVEVVDRLRREAGVDEL